MSSSDDPKASGSKSGSSGGGKPRRPAAVIEGQATEVRDDATSAQAEEARAAESETGTAAEADALSSAAGAEPESAEDDTLREDAGDDAPHDDDARTAPPPPQRSRPADVSGFFTHLAAGLVGGLIGVLVAGVGIHQFPQLFSGVTVSQQVRDRLASLQSKVDDLESSRSNAVGQSRVTELSDRLDAVSARTADLEKTSGSPASVDKRLKNLEASFDAIGMSAKGDHAGDLAQATALTRHINDVQDALEGEIAELKSNIEDAGNGPIRQKLQQVSASVDDLSQQVAALREQASDVNASALKDRVASVEQQAQSLKDRLASETSARQKTALAVAFADLKDAADAGKPFAGQLADVKSHAGKPLKLDAAERLSASGAPTRDALRKSYAQASQAALKAAGADTPDSDGNLWDRMLANARSLVSVRRKGAPAGSGPADILARGEQQLASGDLKGAVATVGKLPAKPRDAMSGWLQKANDRLALDADIARAEGQVNAAQANGNS